MVLSLQSLKICSLLLVLKILNINFSRNNSTKNFVLF